MVELIRPPSLGLISDVTITSPADNELLAYDSTSGEWINQTPTEAGLDTRYYTQDQINELIAGANFDYYLSDTADGTIANYNLMYSTATGQAQSTIVTTVSADTTLLKSFVTETSQPDFTTLSEGSYHLHLHASAVVLGTKTVRLYWTLSQRTAAGAETVLVTSEESDVLVGTETQYDLHGNVPAEVTLASDDRLVLKVYANIQSATGNNPDVTIYMEGTTDSRLGVRTNLQAFDNRYAPLAHVSEKSVHGLSNSGNYTLTIPATGIAALLGTANVFTQVLEVDNTIKVVSNGDKFALYENDADEADAFFKLTNNTGSGGLFGPRLHMKSNRTDAGSDILGDLKTDAVTDSGAAINISARLNNAGAITNRPALRVTNWTTTLLQIGASGNVLINSTTDDATHKLQINGPTKAADYIYIEKDGGSGILQIDSYGTANRAQFVGKTAHGTLASPSAVGAGDLIFYFGGHGYGTSQFNTAADVLISFRSADTFTNTSHPSYITFETTPASSTTRAERMRINPAGEVQIGSTTDLGAYILQVTGDAYFTANVSALTFTDRTPYPKDKLEAYEAIKSMKKRIDDDLLDHSALHPSLKSGEDGRDLSKTVSALAEVVKDLIIRIENMEQQ